MYYCAAHPDLCGLAKPTRHCSEWKLIQCASCARYESGVRRPHFGVPNVRHPDDGPHSAGHLGSTGDTRGSVPVLAKKVKRRKR